MKKGLIMLSLLSFLLVSFRMPVRANEGMENSASQSAVVVEKRNTDLTVPDVREKRLLDTLNGQKLEGWSGFNVLKIALRKAVADGVSPNTLVLLFLFPLVAGLVAFSRQVIGLSGFGMIVPAMLSVAFLSTGGVAGLILLAYIVGSAVLGRMLFKKAKVPYLPKLAIIIWFVSLTILLLLLGSNGLGLVNIVKVGIFPILLFILLAETFIEAQITRNAVSALAMTIETTILAFVAYKVMSSVWVQRIVLLQPEISVIFILALDWLIGMYKGLRLLEVWRFRKLLKK